MGVGVHIHTLTASEPGILGEPFNLTSQSPNPETEGWDSDGLQFLKGSVVLNQSVMGTSVSFSVLEFALASSPGPAQSLLESSWWLKLRSDGFAGYLLPANLGGSAPKVSHSLKQTFS